MQTPLASSGLAIQHRHLSGDRWGRLTPYETEASAIGEADFSAMLRGFRRSGGLMRGCDFLDSLRSRSFVSGIFISPKPTWDELLHFEWAGSTWLPAFQFQRESFCPCPELTPVLRELDPELQGWHLIAWFAARNSRLANDRPANVLSVDPPAVCNAARATHPGQGSRHYVL